MTRHDDACFLMPIEAGDDLAASPVGSLTPVLTQAGDTESFTLYDTFGQPLRQEQRVLVAFADRLELWDAEGNTLSQPGERRLAFVADMAGGPVKHALPTLPALRSLMATGSGQIHVSELALMDDEEKTQARASLRLLSADSAAGVAVAELQGLRGYDKALSKLTEPVRSARPISTGGSFPPSYPMSQSPISASAGTRQPSRPRATSSRPTFPSRAVTRRVSPDRMGDDPAGKTKALSRGMDGGVFMAGQVSMSEGAGNVAVHTNPLPNLPRLDIPKPGSADRIDRTFQKMLRVGRLRLEAPHRLNVQHLLESALLHHADAFAHMPNHAQVV